MKNIILSAIAALFISNSFAQDELIGSYFWNESVIMQSCTVTGADVKKPRFVDSKEGQKFKVIGEDKKGNAIIKILDYTKKNSGSKNQVDATIYGFGKDFAYRPSQSFFTYNFNGTPAEYEKLGSTKTNARFYESHQLYFRVPRHYIEKFATKSERVSGSLAVGALNFPFKLRVPKNAPTDFAGSFNMGLTFGYKFAHKSHWKWSFTVLGGFSFSNIVLDSISVQKNHSNLGSSNNFGSISLSCGVMAEYQGAQLGIFVGTDMLNRINQSTYDWDYQKAPWVSVGIGYSIFAPENRKANPARLVKETNK